MNLAASAPDAMGSAAFAPRKLDHTGPSWKILMATHYFESHRGGIEIVAGELYRRFAQRGHQVTWIAGNTTAAPDPIGNSCATGLPIFNGMERKTGVPFPIPTLRALKQIRRAVANADVVLLHDCLYLTNIAVYLSARMKRIPVAVTQHIASVPFRSPLLRAFLRLGNTLVTCRMLTNSEKAVFVSELTFNHFKHLRFKSEPEIIFNGVETNLFHPPNSKQQKESARRTFDIPEELRTMLFVGRFVEKKGICALRLMAERRRDFNWVFAGWGPHDPTSWGYPNVQVFNGLGKDTLAELYRACDLLVLPSTGEGFPLVIQEALASGLPVVCGDDTARADPGMAPYVRGCRVQPDDHELTAKNFLAGIDHLMAERGSLVKDRREFAIRSYSWQSTCDRYLRIFSDLITAFFRDRSHGGPTAGRVLL